MMGQSDGAGPGADVEDGLARRETGGAEPAQHLAAPQPVLEAEPRDFVVAGAEEIVAFAHGAGVRRGGGWCHPETCSDT